jgi:thioredoxin reductase (NADPH)
MPRVTQPLIERRHDQVFPRLEPAEIDRLRRFGMTRSYAPGEYLVTTGKVGLGMVVILGGEVLVTQRDESGRRQPIVTHEYGSFLGELAQLSAGRLLRMPRLEAPSTPW